MLIILFLPGLKDQTRSKNQGFLWIRLSALSSQQYNPQLSFHVQKPRNKRQLFQVDVLLEIHVTVPVKINFKKFFV